MMCTFRIPPKHLHWRQKSDQQTWKCALLKNVCCRWKRRDKCHKITAHPGRFMNNKSLPSINFTRLLAFCVARIVHGRPCSRWNKLRQVFLFLSWFSDHFLTISLGYFFFFLSSFIRSYSITLNSKLLKLDHHTLTSGLQNSFAFTTSNGVIFVQIIEVKLPNITRTTTSKHGFESKWEKLTFSSNFTSVSKDIRLRGDQHWFANMCRFVRKLTKDEELEAF